jgi:hypothetical protein
VNKRNGSDVAIDDKNVPLTSINPPRRQHLRAPILEVKIIVKNYHTDDNNDYRNITNDNNIQVPGFY